MSDFGAQPIAHFGAKTPVELLQWAQAVQKDKIRQQPFLASGYWFIHPLAGFDEPRYMLMWQPRLNPQLALVLRAMLMDSTHLVDMHPLPVRAYCRYCGEGNKQHTKDCPIPTALEFYDAR
jgi:hypothetical protein